MSRIFIPTYLYVKTHNITGLKYFGKTIKDPFKYKGSGKWWSHHIQKHGYNVTTNIIGYYTIEVECINAALQFSQQNNIVESTEWANLMPENGINGGLQYNSGQTFKLLNSQPRSKYHSNQISKGLKGIKHSDESNLKKSLNKDNRHTGEPKPLIICRLSDRKEMSATGFSLYIRRWCKE
jgi:hypothetical protein